MFSTKQLVTKQVQVLGRLLSGQGRVASTKRHPFDLLLSSSKAGAVT